MVRRIRLRLSRRAARKSGHLTRALEQERAVPTPDDGQDRWRHWATIEALHRMTMLTRDRAVHWHPAHDPVEVERWIYAASKEQK